MCLTSDFAVRTTESLPRVSIYLALPMKRPEVAEWDTLLIFREVQ